MLDLKPDEYVPLEVRPDGTQRVHVFDEESILAVNTAWAAERPLLIRGEPGVGKSQLAEAVARHTNRKFIPFVVDSKTEARDLLWRFDAVKRLADAQLLGAVGGARPRAGVSEDERVQCLRDWLDPQLAEQNYVVPGPLWWAFDWVGAQTQTDVAQATSPYPHSPGDPTEGCVVLIDEIDKAETDVPNGLLGALGGSEFQPFGIDQPIRVQAKRPLVIITTNEERALPNAFVRRCIVHCMDVPDRTPEQLTPYLVGRGQLHFPKLHDDVLRDAAKQLWQDRRDAQQQQLTPYPGQAEYLDLLRAVSSLEKTKAKQQALLKRISPFALRKNRDATP